MEKSELLDEKPTILLYNVEKTLETHNYKHIKKLKSNCDLRSYPSYSQLKYLQYFNLNGVSKDWVADLHDKVSK